MTVVQHFLVGDEEAPLQRKIYALLLGGKLVLHLLLPYRFQLKTINISKWHILRGISWAPSHRSFLGQLAARLCLLILKINSAFMRLLKIRGQYWNHIISDHLSLETMVQINYLVIILTHSWPGSVFRLKPQCIKPAALPVYMKHYQPVSSLHSCDACRREDGSHQPHSAYGKILIQLHYSSQITLLVSPEGQS